MRNYYIRLLSVHFPFIFSWFHAVSRSLHYKQSSSRKPNR